MLRKENYRDMEKYLKTRNAQRLRYYRKTQGGKNTGKLWTRDEIDMIMEKKHSDTELSKLLARSVGTIQAMRSRIKKGSEKSN